MSFTRATALIATLFLLGCGVDRPTQPAMRLAPAAEEALAADSPFKNLRAVRLTSQGGAFVWDLDVTTQAGQTYALAVDERAVSGRARPGAATPTAVAVTPTLAPKLARQLGVALHALSTKEAAMLAVGVPQAELASYKSLLGTTGDMLAREAEIATQPGDGVKAMDLVYIGSGSYKDGSPGLKLKKRATDAAFVTMLYGNELPVYRLEGGQRVKARLGELERRQPVTIRYRETAKQGIVLGIELVIKDEAPAQLP